MPEASRKEGPDLVGAGVKKLSFVGGCNGNLFERSEFISVQPPSDSFSSTRRSLDFCFFSSRKRRGYPSPREENNLKTGQII